MKIIALTGGIGSGKSTVLNEFNKLGADIISCDEISHRIMLKGESAYNEVLENFGVEILNTNGEIDRKALAAIVFADNQKLQLLNTITHRLIYNEIKKQIEESVADVICVEIPLLFSTKSPLNIDMKIAVVAPKNIRIKRVIQRDGITKEEVEARMAQQLPDDILCQKADCVIQNDGDLEGVKRKVKEIYNDCIRA